MNVRVRAVPDLGAVSNYFPKVHHDNFLSLRSAAVNAPNSLGVAPNDGPQHIRFDSDLITTSTDTSFGE